MGQTLSMKAYFSVSEFAHNLSERISDQSLVIDFRDCDTVSILLDQELLYWVSSPVFRPDLSIVEINVDNIKQVRCYDECVE